MPSTGLPSTRKTERPETRAARVEKGTGPVRFEVQSPFPPRAADLSGRAGPAPLPRRPSALGMLTLPARRRKVLIAAGLLAVLGAVLALREAWPGAPVAAAAEPPPSPAHTPSEEPPLPPPPGPPPLPGLPPTPPSLPVVPPVPARKQAEFTRNNLHAGNPASKVNNTSAEVADSPPAPPPPPAPAAPRAEEPKAGAPSPAQPGHQPHAKEGKPETTEPPVAPAPLPLPGMGAVEVPPPAPALPVPAPAPPTVPVPAPEEFESIRNPHPGDTPMMARWHRLGWSTVLAAAFLAAPAAVQAQSDSQKLDEILNQLKTAKEDRDALRDEIRRLRTETGLSVQAAQEKVGRLGEDLKRLGDDVQRLQRDLERMRTDGTNPSIRQAGGINPPATTTATTGRIRMRNLFSAPEQIRLNGTVYTLEPGETYEVCAPLGEFTYEVLGIQGPRTDVLTADKAYNIVVYTR
jgi:hypothetical protein